jgi:hypothetical protein
MRWLPTLVALLLSGSGAAWAQADLTTAPGPAACLQVEGGGAALPEYPDVDLLRKVGGTVRAELTFTAPDSAPKLKFLDEDAASTTINAAVSRLVRRLRLPCMTAQEAPVVLRQDYVFVPNDGRKVVASEPEDQADRLRSEQIKCLRHLDDAKRPEYPDWARSQGVQENIYFELRFEGKDQPPTMTLLAPRRAELLFEVKRFVARWRLPCMGEEPVVLRMLFRYRMEGGSRLLLKDMGLKTLVGAARELPAPVFFDLNAMGCPFDLRLSYYQPWGRNRVHEIETAVPARKPFINWLRDVRLKLTERQAEQVLGDTFTLTVPCGTVDL